MRVIVLRPWANNRTLVVVIILIPDVPIQPVIDLDRQTTIRRLEAHGIRRNQKSRVAGWIRHTRALAGVLVYSVADVKRCPARHLTVSFNVEETVPHEIQAVAYGMLDAVEEIVDHRVAVNPVVVVADADGEFRVNRPINRGSEHS